MRRRSLATAAVCAIAAAGVATPALADSSGVPSAAALTLGRQTLPANDGWAASGTGTTGGSAADDAHVFVAHNRAELVTALGGDNATNGKNTAPKMVFLSGRIDGNVDADNHPLTCADYVAPGYSLPAYLAAYDPAVWGRTSRPTGPLEDARVASTRNQSARVVINVGPNTTIVGLRGAKLTGVNLLVNKASNVIVRNLTMEDAHDCFPAWDPTDGSTGNWNSLYDTMSLTGGTNVWVDHDTFSDGGNHDSGQPLYFGRPYQVHDGLLDITKASDLVTVEDSVFYDHDKTMLIGSSDSATADTGRLRVTLHHSKFANTGQRVPRVRYGQVDVYDNYYVATDEKSYTYSWGVGVNSAIYAQNNFVLLSADVPQSQVVHGWGGTAMTEIGSMVRYGTAPPAATSFLAAYNAANDPDLGADAGWTPTLRAAAPTPTPLVPVVVSLCAGAGRLPT
jgi:pectate lyase